MEAALFIGLTTGQAQVVSAVALIVVSGLAALSALGAYREARRTRKQAVRPALALDLVSVTHGYVELGVVNVGQGAALDVDVELAFVPEGGAEPVRRRWTWPLIRPGRSYQFAPPDVGGKRRPDLETWATLYPRVALTGTVRDQLDKEHRVALQLTDLVAIRDLAMDADLASPLRETPEQRSSKTVAKAAGEISSTLARVAAALERRADGD